MAGGRAWVSTDAGRRWERRSEGLPASGGIDALALDPLDASRLWAVVADQVFRSEDQGRSWRSLGQPVPERPVVARALAVVDHVIVMATDRGVYRSPDDGAHWTLGSEILPAHLQTDMLTRDPVDLATIYTGFAVSSHERLAQLAVQDSNMLGAITPGQLAGGIGVLAVALLAAAMAVRRLMRTHQAPRPVVPQ